MNILSASYTNIWPFTDQTVSIDFRNGSHLIQAPIGSGKSFLFFDGPLFGLYKYRNRPILNKQSKKGSVQVLFEADEQFRLVERSLTPTKKWGESIKTKLWSVENIPLDKGGKEELVTTGGFATETTSQDNPLILNLEGKKLTDTLPIHTLSAVEFTSSSEGEQAILDLLPPREVTLSINFLMQESVSVFELTPTERVQVFKHLFWLLGIDDAKDKINDRRKELQTMINVKGDLTDQNKKLQTLLGSIQRTYKDVHSYIDTKRTSPLISGEWRSLRVSPGGKGEGELVNEGNLNRNTIPESPFFSDLLLMWDQVSNATLEDFSLDANDYTWIPSLIISTQENISLLTKLQWERTQIEAQLQQITRTHLTTTQDHSQLIKNIQAIESSMQSKGPEDRSTIDNTSNTDEIQRQRTARIQEIENLEKSIPREAFEEYWSPLKSSSQLDELISWLLHQGKTIKQKKENSTLRLEQLTKQQQDHRIRLEEIQKQMTTLQTSYEQQHRFHCDKIEWSCPYIDLINTSASNALTKQKDHLQWQKQKIEQQIQTSASEDQKKQLVTQQAALQKQIEDLKSFLTQIDRKNLQTVSQQIKEKHEQKKKLDQQREAHLEQEKRFQSQKEELIKLKEQEKQLVKQLAEQKSQLQLIEKNLTQKKVETHPERIATLTSHKQHLEKMHHSCQSLSTLLTEVTEQRIQIKTLKEKLLIVKDLYQIFSKELMTVVLQDFLPTLQEVLNSYLSQIVDYQIKFLTPTSAEESWASQLELDIQIIDEKWTRSVKSLSWWQKTVLKLVWMLWVATIFKSKFLLLDETINNLDVHTISQVADVLKDFVTSQQIKFYVVTHSPQIQEMDIWESVVRVG